MSTIDQDGRQVLIEAMYARYGSVHLEECATIEEALSFLGNGSERCELYAIGVLADGRCVRADPYLNPNTSPTPDEAGEVEKVYREHVGAR